jgi:vacuolar-type H+-ATPase subunit E/Vma4
MIKSCVVFPLSAFPSPGIKNIVATALALKNISSMFPGILRFAAEWRLFMLPPEEKLKKFKNAILKETDEQANQILAEIDDFKNQELANSKEQTLEEYFYEMQAEITKIKQDCKRCVSTAELNAKRELLIKREQIAEKIFNVVSQKLVDFTSSADYKTYLLKGIQNSFENASISGSELFLKPADMGLKKEIEDSFNNQITVTELDSIVIGGFIVKNEAKGILIDETLDYNLKNQHSYFNQISNLKVD